MGTVIKNSSTTLTQFSVRPAPDEPSWEVNGMRAVIDEVHVMTSTFSGLEGRGVRPEVSVHFRIRTIGRGNKLNEAPLAPGSKEYTRAARKAVGISTRGRPSSDVCCAPETLEWVASKISPSTPLGAILNSALS